MKKKIFPFRIALGVFLISSMISCQKESVSTPIRSTSLISEVDDEAAVTKTVDSSGVICLTLKPSNKDGQDTYVTFWNDDADWANSTGDWAEELSMASWTREGSPMGVRSYIRFDSINLIPAGAKILSAKLCLSAKGSSISAPQGNSVYPGSPYINDNSCKVERVTGGTWQEATLTWNTQPSVTTTDAAYIPSSTSQWDYETKVNVTNMVKAIAADPSKNYGFRISLVNESNFRSLIFASSKNTNPKLRPKLVIRYK